MSTTLNGTQIDIQAALITQSETQRYEHYYKIISVVSGSDLNDEYVNVTFNTCDPNPCQNNGTCYIGLANSHYCTCTSKSFTGKVLLIDYFYKNYEFSRYIL